MKEDCLASLKLHYYLLDGRKPQEGGAKLVRGHSLGIDEYRDRILSVPVRDLITNLWVPQEASHFKVLRYVNELVCHQMSLRHDASFLCPPTYAFVMKQRDL